MRVLLDGRYVQQGKMVVTHPITFVSFEIVQTIPNLRTYNFGNFQVDTTVTSLLITPTHAVFSGTCSVGGSTPHPVGSHLCQFNVYTDATETSLMWSTSTSNAIQPFTSNYTSTFTDRMLSGGSMAGHFRVDFSDLRMRFDYNKVELTNFIATNLQNSNANVTSRFTVSEV